MKDMSVTSSGKKNNSQKRVLLRNYIIICAVFLMTVVLSTFFIRTLYTDLHLETVTKEAKGVTELAKKRFTDYAAFDSLVEYWSEAKLTKPHEEHQQNFIQNRETLLETDVTPEELEALGYEGRQGYVRSNYAKLSSGFDKIYQNFDIKNLYCVKFTSDDVKILFTGHGTDDGESIFKLPEIDIPSNFDTYETLINDPDIIDGAGKMTKIRYDDGSMGLRFTVFVSQSEEHLCVLIWERDWSAVLREINIGALKISLFTSLLLMTIFLTMLHMYRKYETERLRAGIEKERSKAEIDICRRIQLSQLPEPSTEFSGLPEADVNVFIRPAKEVGGDFCDCFMIDENKIGLVIADVSDKGLPAAMFMMMAKSLIRNEMKQGRSPEEAIKKANFRLADRNDAGMFVTVWLAEIDLSTGVCRTVNAGHENPAVKHGGKEWEILRYPHDMPAAMFREATYNVRTAQLHDGDMIFVYTDGVTEAVNADDERFGESRITQTLNSLGSAGTRAVIDGLFAEICSFSAGAEQYDDIGMICFKYHGRKE